MASIAVIGLGSIGTIFATHLIAGDHHRVICCVRAPVESIRVEGEYGALQAVPCCVTDPSAAAPVDWVLLAVKSQDTAGAAPWLRHLCQAATQVAVLQNGVDQPQRMTPYIDPAKVLPTVVYANGKKLAPHCIRHLCPGDDLIVPATAQGEGFAKLFESSGLRVRTEEGFLTASWQKFLANLVANPLTALTGRGIEVVRCGEMEQLALGILREACAIGRARGAKISANAPEETLRWMARYPGDTGTSMLQDRRDGRSLEVEALTGTVVRLGEELDIPTPLNRAIRALLLAGSALP